MKGVEKVNKKDMDTSVLDKVEHYNIGYNCKKDKEKIILIDLRSIPENKEYIGILLEREDD